VPLRLLLLLSPEKQHLKLQPCRCLIVMIVSPLVRVALVAPLAAVALLVTGGERDVAEADPARLPLLQLTRSYY